MLVKAPELIDGMIEISHQRRWLQCTLAAIRFQQCIVQALWYTDSPFLQLPHLTESDARAAVKGAKDQGRALAEFQAAADADKKVLVRLSEEERTDVLKASRLLPQLEVRVELFVEEEEPEFLEEGEEPSVVPEDAVRGDQIYENDLVTLRVVLTRANVAEGDEAPPVHAPLFPAIIREGWWLILTDKPRDDPKKAPGESEAVIHAIERIGDQGRVVKHELRFMAPPQHGEYAMQLRVVSDCYMGLDEDIEVCFTVRPAAELPEYAPHPEDVKLDDEPTLFEQVMTADMEDSSDEEDDEDEATPASSKDLKRSGVKAMTSPISLEEDSEEEED
jgi:translocation protein SEC63